MIQTLNSQKYPIHYVSLIKLELWFYCQDFDIWNYEMIINVRISNSVVSLFIHTYVDSGAGLILFYGSF